MVSLDQSSNALFRLSVMYHVVDQYFEPYSGIMLLVSAQGSRLVGSRAGQSDASGQTLKLMYVSIWHAWKLYEVHQTQCRTG